jgi:hypothetical protein
MHKFLTFPRSKVLPPEMKFNVVYSIHNTVKTRQYIESIYNKEDNMKLRQRSCQKLQNLTEVVLDCNSESRLLKLN